jgi:hypothetical protein
MPIKINIFSVVYTVNVFYAGIFDSLTWGVIPKYELAKSFLVSTMKEIREGSMEVPGDILFRYLERRKRDLEMCLLSLESKNYSELEKVGHQLKGNGLTFGHPDLSSIGSHMEVAAASHNESELEKALKDFSSWVSHHIN